MQIAIIPARGGSKRIPLKNIREFNGRPIICYSIESAQRSRLFDRIIVSTDDRQIAEIATQYGAEVPFFRSVELADDFTGTNAVIADVVERLQLSGVTMSAICCIYATAPFIRNRDLNKGLELLNTGNWNYVFSATAYRSSIHRAFHRECGGGVEMYFPENHYRRSQDLDESLHDAGQFYWARPETWVGRTECFNKDSTVVVVPHWRVQDIDTLGDWSRAEMMYKVLQDLNV